MKLQKSSEYPQDSNAMTSLKMHLEPPESQSGQGFQTSPNSSGFRWTDKPRWPIQRWRYLQHQILLLASESNNSRRGAYHAIDAMMSPENSVTHARRRILRYTEQFNNLGANVGHSNASTTTGRLGSDKRKIAAHWCLYGHGSKPTVPYLGGYSHP